MSSTTPASLAIVVPTLGRPHALEALVTAFRESTAPGYRIMFVVHPDDGPTLDAIASVGWPEVTVLRCEGRYAACINAAVAATDEQFLLIGADDIRPRPGWYEAALARMSDTIGFVSTNDLGNEEVLTGQIATHPLVARWYAERVGALYDEGYFHNGANADASERAKRDRAFAFAFDSVVEHMHPNYGKAEVDETYRVGALDEAGNAADYDLLTKRWG